MAPDEFAARYWGVRPLLSPAAELPGPFTDLLDLDAVDELLSRRGLRTPFLRIAKDGDVVEPRQFTRSGGAGAEIADQVADDRVLAQFLDGSTLVLQGLHRIWPALIDFGGQLTSDLGSPVQINAYVTPAANQGFAPHWDVHDVFVLQVAGEKRWRIHPPVLDAPLRDQPWTDHRAAVERAAAAEPLIDTVLRPGDALYLPRGWLHAAQALGQTSAHLTVGVHPVTRRSLVDALVRLLDDDPELRSSLPLGLDLSDPAALAPHLAATVAAMTDRLAATDSRAVARLVTGTVRGRSRPAPLNPLATAAALERLGPDTEIALREHLPHDLREHDGGLDVVLADRTVRFPPVTASAVRRLLEGGPVRVGDLPGLDAADATVLARRAVREAVAVIVGT